MQSKGLVVRNNDQTKNSKVTWADALRLRIHNDNDGLDNNIEALLKTAVFTRCCTTLVDYDDYWGETWFVYAIDLDKECFRVICRRGTQWDFTFDLPVQRNWLDLLETHTQMAEARAVWWHQQERLRFRRKQHRIHQLLDQKKSLQKTLADVRKQLESLGYSDRPVVIDPLCIARSLAPCYVAFVPSSKKVFFSGVLCKESAVQSLWKGVLSEPSLFNEIFMFL